MNILVDSSAWIDFFSLIASYAIINNIQIFHKDRDFELISQETKLKTYKI
jgi:predicted nucleic acid-binding protein